MRFSFAFSGGFERKGDFSSIDQPLRSFPVADYSPGRHNPRFVCVQSDERLRQLRRLPDGKKFLINTINTEETGAPLILVLNWTAELKK